jgi:hypothetical protein
MTTSSSIPRTFGRIAPFGCIVTGNEQTRAFAMDSSMIVISAHSLAIPDSDRETKSGVLSRKSFLERNAFAAARSTS